MDVFSHGLWAGAAALALNRAKKTKIRYWHAAFWGVFPDVFAFAPLTLVLLWERIVRGARIPFGPDMLEPVPPNLARLFSLTPHLYELSHSIVVFSLVFGLTILITKKKPWAMGGWLLHILADIPTHSYRFYPTPFLWPISNLKFNGFSWGQWWFMLLNYSALLLVYLWLYKGLGGASLFQRSSEGNQTEKPER